MTFTLNGKETEYSGDSAMKLLDALREVYGLTGVKCGCGEGECGACSVLYNGALANSCLIAMGTVAGDEVVTIEGYRTTEQFMVLDKAFADAGAVQCGFCIPGMILAAECILRNNPHPTEDDIRRGIAGNLCRCTGYNSIVSAISAAAKAGEGLW